MTEVSQLQQRPRWQQGLLDEVRTLGLWEEGLLAGKEPEGPRKKSPRLAEILWLASASAASVLGKATPRDTAKNPVFLEHTWITGQRPKQ